MKTINELCDVVRKYVISCDTMKTARKAPGVFLSCFFAFFALQYAKVGLPRKNGHRNCVIP